MKAKWFFIIAFGIVALAEHGWMVSMALAAYNFLLHDHSDMPLEIWDIALFGGLALVNVLAAVVMRTVLRRLHDPFRAWIWTLLAMASAPLMAWFCFKTFTMPMGVNLGFIAMFAIGPIGAVLTYVFVTALSSSSRVQERGAPLTSRELKSLGTAVLLVSLSMGYLTIKPRLAQIGNPPHFVLQSENIPGHSSFNFAAFSPDGKLVVTSTGISDQPGGVQAWSTQDGKLLWSKSLPSAVYPVLFTPDGKTVVSQNYDDTVKLWSAKNGKLLRTYKFAESTNMTLLEAGKTIALSGGSKVHLYDLKTGKSKRVLRLPNNGDDYGSAIIAPDGKTVVCSFSQKIVVLDARTGAKLLTLPDHSGRSADGMSWMAVDTKFSPDGNLLAIAGGKPSGPKSRQTAGTIRLWDTRAKKELPGLLQSDWVYPVFFSGDGKWLCSASDTDVWLWDTATWTVKRKIRAGMPVAFSKDGKMLVTDDRDENGGAFYSLWLIG